MKRRLKRIAMSLTAIVLVVFCTPGLSEIASLNVYAESLHADNPTIQPSGGMHIQLKGSGNNKKYSPNAGSTWYDFNGTITFAGGPFSLEVLNGEQDIIFSGSELKGSYSHPTAFTVAANATVNLTLVGSSSATTQYASYSTEAYGISTEGKLNISGDGSLTVSSNSADNYSINGYGPGNTSALMISSGSVTTTDGLGVDKLIVNGGELVAQSVNDLDGVAISTRNLYIYDGSTVTATGGTYGLGLYVSEFCGIYGGSVSIKGNCTNKYGWYDNADVECRGYTESEINNNSITTDGFIWIKKDSDISCTKTDGVTKWAFLEKDSGDYVFRWYAKTGVSVSFTTTKTLSSGKVFLWKAVDGKGNVVDSKITTGKTAALTMPSTYTDEVTVSCTEVSPYHYYDPTTDSTTNVTNVAMINSDTTEFTNSNGANGWYVLDAGRSVTFDSRMNVSGKVNIILLEGSSLTALKGIGVTDGNSLTVWTADKNTSCSLNAGVDSSGKRTIDHLYSGIGSKYFERGDNTSELQTGTITINGGNVTAAGGSAAAGIGGGDADCGTITINDGTIKATGGDCGAGIGGGQISGKIASGGTINITGGNVFAKADGFGAGIGGGNESKCDKITISGGEISITISKNVYKNRSAEDIGAGYYYDDDENDSNRNSSTVSVTVPHVTVNDVTRYALSLTNCSMASGDYEIYGENCLYVAAGSASVQQSSAPAEGYCNEWKTDGITEYTESTGETFSFTMSANPAAVSVSTVEYVPTYTVTIPETVQLGETLTISASGVNVTAGKSLDVSISGDSKFEVKNGDETLGYTINLNNNPIAPGDSLFTVAGGVENNSGSAELTFATPALADIKFSGIYTGTVTFTISVE